MSDETKPEVKPEERPEPKNKEPDMSWLPERLQREREKAEKDLAAKLGMSVDDAKAKLAEYKKVEDEHKSELQKALETVSKFEQEKARLADLERAVSVRSQSEMSALTDIQRAAVVAVAGEDAARQLMVIEQLKPTWKSIEIDLTGHEKIKEALSKVDELAKATTAPPAGTNSGPSGSVTSAGRTDHTAEYRRLKETNPFAAATYGLQRVEEVYKPKTS